MTSTVMNRRAALGLMFALVACEGAQDMLSRAELNSDASARGLALVRARGTSIVVIPFDSPDFYLRSEPGVELTGFGKAGTVISWSGDPLRGRREFLIATTGGTTITSAHETGKSFGVTALSESAKRLTYLSPPSLTRRGPGLSWTSFDFSQGGFVDNSDGDNPQGDWSHDGRFIAYEKAGSVYSFDTENGLTKRLVAGHDPSWSPTGNYISYRTPNGRVALITPEGQSVNWPPGQHLTVSAIRWSPTGKYVAFVEARPFHIPLIGSYYRLVVCRVSDGKGVAVREFGPGSPDLQGFYWIVDYRDFCAKCTHGAPFN